MRRQIAKWCPLRKRNEKIRISEKKYRLLFSFLIHAIRLKQHVNWLTNSLAICDLQQEKKGKYTIGASNNDHICMSLRRNSPLQSGNINSFELPALWSLFTKAGLPRWKLAWCRMRWGGGTETGTGMRGRGRTSFFCEKKGKNEHKTAGGWKKKKRHPDKTGRRCGTESLASSDFQDIKIGLATIAELHYELPRKLLSLPL